MKVIVTLLTFIFTIQYSFSAGYEASYNGYKITFQDTTKQTSDSIDETIDEVIRTGTIPKTEKIQYVNKITKYGFKSLFKNLSYNSSIPYSSQVNPYAETYMQDYLEVHGSYLQKMKGTSQLYFNLIDKILAQYGLPKELKYLAVIESDLKPQALSWAGARGPWQFMSYTARGYGLMVNGYVDERTDYYKSTNAAARYLLSLYKDLKDWLLVIAAYNGGSGRVYTAIKKSGSRNFWALQYYLPAESRNHVKKFIATHYIMEGVNSGTSDFNYAALNNTNIETVTSKLTDDEITGTEVLGISGKYNSVIIAKNLAMDINEFNRMNPGLDALLALGNDYNLRLMPDKMNLFVANKYVILNECVQILLNDVNEPVKTTYMRHSNNPVFKRK
ncbi:MAG: lytic transglycosylase domain-containing protein [Ginsengibacter sp.]